MKAKIKTTPEIAAKLGLAFVLGQMKEPPALEIDDIKDNRLHLTVTIDNEAELDALIAKYKDLDDSIVTHQIIKRVKQALFVEDSPLLD